LNKKNIHIFKTIFKQLINSSISELIIKLEYNQNEYSILKKYEVKKNTSTRLFLHLGILNYASKKIIINKILRKFEEFFLVFNHIKMNIYYKNEEIIHLESTSFKKRIISIAGNKIREMLIPIQENTSLVNITGYICKPEIAKKIKKNQFIFINSEKINNTELHKAVKKGFDKILIKEVHPMYFIELKINEQHLDFQNKYNTKKIILKDELAICLILETCIKKSLAENNIIPTIDFNLENAFNLERGFKNNIEEPKIKIDPNFNPFNKEN